MLAPIPTINDTTSSVIRDVTEDIKKDINNIKLNVSDELSNIHKEIDGIKFSNDELIGIADAIYARRCNEHVMILRDCPKNIRGGFWAFFRGKRNIPPYCCKWCDMIDNPTATIKDWTK